ncbi:hypothetical protein FQN54_001034 [Arachnomyces sp. PD_36]|nr:hypothetical protein FQN54_001034 [Arachnomyces sp. PD_36]
MRFTSLLPLALATGAFSIDLVIPQVKAAVDAALEEYGNYVAYGGPTNEPPAELPTTAGNIMANGSYWLENIKHQGVAPFAGDDYQVFRNVKDFGAKGDGSTDDTAAIQEAIASGNRCGEGCASSTITPAVVYFPAGTYMISYPIFDYYHTVLIGDPTSLPVIKGASNFEGGYLIDGNPYFTENLNWISTTVFFRQIRNFVLDLTDVPGDVEVSGIHWPTAQATTLQNVVFEMSEEEGNQHQGLFCESGSAGFAGDLVFNGGKVGAAVGNQQFTMRNLTFNNSQTAILHFWDWGWTYYDVKINDCQVGIDISAADGEGVQSTGSITLFDSSIKNTPIGIKTAHSQPSKPVSAGNVILENLSIDNVPVVVENQNSTVLEGSSGSDTIAAWGQGRRVGDGGAEYFQEALTPVKRPESLLAGDVYYARSKPQYESLSVESFSSVRSGGAKGDATTDDTAALQKVIDEAASSDKIVFFDAGIYRVTKTLKVPANSKIVGEGLSVLMSSGEFFNNIDAPKPVVQVGASGDEGQVEWSDMIIGTQGPQAGAILIEWNLASPAKEPSGVWDVHARVGGFEGSNQGAAECAKAPDTTHPPVDEKCIAAYMLVHVTKSASGLLMENCWMWVADHDLEEEANNQQISIYVGRGIYVESTEGNIWLWASSSEHSVLYQYQFASSKNIFMGQIQTESAYYQPNPDATVPFPPVADLNDPDFATSCKDGTGNCAVGWGVRVLETTDLLIYGAGLYSFFDNWDVSCSNYNGTDTCQESIFSIDAKSSVSLYNLNTIGVPNMVTVDGQSQAVSSENVGVFADSLTLFTSGSQ